MTVYRDHNDSLPAMLVCGAQRETWAGNGKLLRSVQCEFPGWWSRFWNGVEVGDIWQCIRCRKKYRWTRANGWAQEPEVRDFP